MTNMQKTFRYFDTLLVLFVVTLLISNIIGTKLIEFGSIITDGGVILFPLAYILGDVITEVYGYKFTRRAIWMAFSTMLLAVTVFTIVRYLPPAADYEHQAAFEAVLGFFPRIVFASLAAFLVGSFANSWLLAKLKVATKGKKLWLRLLGSTIVGEFLDTVVFALIAFGGIITGGDMMVYILVGVSLKTLAEVVLMPITYSVVAYIKYREGVDVYDKQIDFNPFRLGL